MSADRLREEIETFSRTATWVDGIRLMLRSAVRSAWRQNSRFAPAREAGCSSRSPAACDSRAASQCFPEADSAAHAGW